MKKLTATHSSLSLLVILSAISLLPRYSSAQLPEQWSSSEIMHQMKGLNTLGSVLYLAAHPDDENTRFISYCVNELHMRTAYLSITRGDGGQNLIGKEIGPELGLIRSNELLMARHADGGMQYFTPSIDFGYSKSPEETLEIWGKDMVLNDVVKVIRHFKPDVIVCRFPTDGGGGHGHHTASALLGEEAFYLAADSSYMPKSLQGFPAWQTKRIVVNTGRWWNEDISADDPGVVAEDVGAFVELLGTSCTELAAKSRSKHKSQGFGSTGTRGEKIEYFEHLGGSMARESLFDGLDQGWNRVKGGKTIALLIDKLLESYRVDDPAKSIPALVKLKKALDAMPESHWKNVKSEKVEELLLQCAAVFAEAKSDTHYGLKGDSLHIELELIARNWNNVRVKSIRCESILGWEEQSLSLEKNVSNILKLSGVISRQVEFSTPYWLKREGTLGRFNIERSEDVLNPVSDPAILVNIIFMIEGVEIELDVPLNKKWNDPVNGESWRPFVIGPNVTIDFNDDNLFLLSEEGRIGTFTLTAYKDLEDVQVALDVPEGWSIEPSLYIVKALRKEEERVYEYSVTSELTEAEGHLRAKLNFGKGDSQAYSQTTIEYDHIPTQFVLRPSELRVVKMNVKRSGGRLAYIPGAGDKVAESLVGLGYEVDELNEDMIKAGGLEKYKAIITGIRLLNVDERFDVYFSPLLEYVQTGGNLIVQYNTRHALKTEKFSPFPITLSRDRVTEEDSEVRFLAEDHPVMKTPNLISEEDFNGWVQERGLYFPSEWDSAYTPILSWNDKGEDAKEGSLLVAPYGKGNYIYTGISFFRELPAGVPGAYRLFVNLIELPTHE